MVLPSIRWRSSDGSLDTDFGTDGIAFANFGGSDTVAALTIQSDGMIVVVGSTSSSPNFVSDFAIARFDTNGGLDPFFDTDGKATVDMQSGYSDYGRAVAIQSDGKIVVGGESSGGSIYQVAVARFTSAGAPAAASACGAGMPCKHLRMCLPTFPA